MTKKELIQEIESYKGTHKGLKTKNKTQLQEILNQLEVESKIMVNGERPLAEKIDKNQEGVPQMHDPEWTEYVMSHFVSDELRDGMPTCDGLRRVFRKIVGTILACDMNVIKPPTMQDPSTTVQCRMQYKPHIRGCTSGRIISDVFDVNPENTPWPYNKASVASAATKAEARVLRKALGLCRVYSSEEVQEGLDAIQSVSENVSDENRPIADNAKTAIQSMSQRLGIDVSKLFVNMEITDKVIDQLSYKESHQVIARLNEYLRGEENKGLAIPEEIKLEMIF